MKTCPCCGQVIPPDLQLSPMQTRIYGALKEKPQTAEQLRDIAGHYYPGRPYVTWSNIYSHIYLLNLKLRPSGVAIRRPCGSPFEAYRLVSL